MLIRPPTVDDLTRIYYELARIGASCVGSKSPWPYDFKDKEGLVCLASDMSRFDPRLFGILVEFFVNSWRELNPTLLRAYHKDMNTPASVAVIGEFLLSAKGDDDEVRFFVQYLSAGLRPVPTQYYYYNLYAPGGYLAQRAIEEPIYEYKKWGFLACERPVIHPIDHARREALGSLDRISRRNILQRLLENRGEISLKEYLSALKFSVSRQQALLDIKESKLVILGKGRGARWRI